jgi:hypothetical protein
MMNEVESVSGVGVDTAYVKVLMAYIRNKYGDSCEVVDRFEAKGENGKMFNGIWISSGGRQNMIRFDYVKRGDAWKVYSFTIRDYFINDAK